MPDGGPLDAPPKRKIGRRVLLGIIGLILGSAIGFHLVAWLWPIPGGMFGEHFNGVVIGVPLGG